MILIFDQNFVFFGKFYSTPFVFNCVMGIIMVIPDASTVSNLVDYFSFAMWTIYALTFVSIIVFRFVEPYKSFERPFKVHKI